MPSERRLKNCYTLSDSYNAYLLKNPKGSFYYITKKEYVEIVNAYLKALAEQVVENSLTVKLPFYNGKLSVCKCKSLKKLLDRSPVDWVASKKAGRRIYISNEHSNGFLYRFLWDKGPMAFLKYYKFKPSRSNARRVAFLVKNKENDYFLSKI